MIWLDVFFYLSVYGYSRDVVWVTFFCVF